MVQFGTMEYFKMIADVTNKDEKIAKSKMDMSLIFHILDKPTENRYLLKFEKGQVTEVREASQNEDAEFVYPANYDVFKKIFTGKLKYQDATRAGWFKIKYSMIKGLKYREALERLMQIQTEFPTEF